MKTSNCNGSKTTIVASVQVIAVQMTSPISTGPFGQNHHENFRLVGKKYELKVIVRPVHIFWASKRV